MSISAQRDVKITAQPGAQGNVPTTPELGKAARNVGKAKIDRQLVAEKLCQADGNHRVAAKVREDLKRETVEQRQKAQFWQKGKLRVLQGQRGFFKIVGDDHFEKKTG